MRIGCRIAAGLCATLAAAALTAAGAAPAGAAPAAEASARLVNTSARPMATTNGRVNALLYVDGTVYVGGKFSSLTFHRKIHARHNLGAVSSATGAPIAFSPKINGQVHSLALSPDKSVLYVGGAFTRVGRFARDDVAAFSIATRKLLNFAPKVAGTVLTIAVTSSGVYLGGEFTVVNGKRRTFAAEVARDGALLPWAPRLDGRVRALLVSPDGTRMFLGGGFHHVNRRADEALAAVGLASGASARFNRKLMPTFRRRGRFSQVTSFATDGNLIFAGAEGTGQGVFDGTLAFRPKTGRLVWRNRCLGATQAVLYLNGVLYKASHAHDCSRSGGFRQIRPGWHAHHLMAEAPGSGKLLRWGTSAMAGPNPLPDTNGGLGTGLGPFALATDGTQLFVGGEFTTVNDKAQEGLTRFGGIARSAV